MNFKQKQAFGVLDIKSIIASFSWDYLDRHKNGKKKKKEKEQWFIFLKCSREIRVGVLKPACYF